MSSTTGYIGGVGQVRITLELTPQQAETGGDILATTILTTERNPVPIEGHTIVFYLGASEVASEQTNVDGRASYAFTNLSFGTHAVSVQTAGVHVTQRHTFTKTAEKIKVPANLKVYAHPEGPAAEYFISVELFGEDKVPTKRWPLEIKDTEHPDAAQRVRVEHTGDDGAHRFMVATNRSRAIFISVVGTPLDYTLRLAGPTRREFQQPPDVPEPTADDLRGSWREITKRAWQRGSADLRKQREEQKKGGAGNESSLV